MPSFVAGFIAAVLIAVIAAFALDSIQKPADSAFATTGARI
jgi:hypothetical protein